MSPCSGGDHERRGHLDRQSGQLLAREFERTQENLNRAPIPGDTPYDRMLYVLGRMTRTMHRKPMLTEAMTRAFMFADPSAAAEVNTVARLMEET